MNAKRPIIKNLFQSARETEQREVNRVFLSAGVRLQKSVSGLKSELVSVSLLCLIDQILYKNQVVVSEAELWKDIQSFQGFT